MKMSTIWVLRGFLFAVAVMFILTGCGGGGGSGGRGAASSLVGTFIDAPVSGLDFESGSGGGITDANGNFTYRQDEKVTFRIGNLHLGSATPANGKVTPLDLVGKADVDDPRVVRILQTLQSLDVKAGTGRVIEIDTNVRETLRTQARVDLDKENDADTDAKVKAMLPETAKTAKSDYKVGESEAKRHFESHKDDESNKDKGYNPPPPPTPGAGGSHVLIAWHDLGMHCVDGKDYSVFSILPPYNNLHAHLIDRTTNKQIGTGVTLTYESVADAGQPSLCADCHKSNALGTPSIAGIKPLTEALHAKHAGVNMPGTNATLDNSANRDSCYLFIRGRPPSACAG